MGSEESSMSKSQESLSGVVTDVGELDGLLTESSHTIKSGG